MLRNTREFHPLSIRHAIGRHDRQVEKTFGILPGFEKLCGHGSGSRPRPGIGQDPFQSIPRVNTDLSFVKGQRDQGAVVLPPLTKFPRFRVTMDKSKKVLAFRGLHGQDFDLSRRPLFQFSKPALKLLLHPCFKNPCLIHHVPSRVGNGNFPCTHGRKHQQDKDDESVHETHEWLPAIRQGLEAINVIIEPGKIIPVMPPTFLQRLTNADKRPVGLLLNPTDHVR